MLGSYTENRLSTLGTHPEILYRLLERAETTLRGSLLRSLGGMSADPSLRELREAVISLAIKSFQSDPDAGVHSAAEWVLRSWGMKDRLAQIATPLATNEPVNRRNWYINHHGHSMIVFKGPIDSQTGSPLDEPGRDASDEGIVIRTIDRDFAVSSTEVTMEQFLKWMPDFRHAAKKDYAPSGDCPIMMITWHRAAEYCVWLSEQEGIPREQFCYKKQGDEMQPEKDYLSRTGYRLPTEAEWEYACRAGASTSFSWGDDPSISSRYAYSVLNSDMHSWPVGSLCPNRFGLFDTHGSVSEWTHDEYKENEPPKSGLDVEIDETIKEDSFRAVRGGTYLDYVSYHRSANRTPAKARNGLSARLGFRIARTVHAAPINR